MGLNTAAAQQKTLQESIQKILQQSPQLIKNAATSTEARVQAELATEATIEARVKDELAKAMPTATVTPMPTVTASTPKQHLQQHRTP